MCALYCLFTNVGFKMAAADVIFFCCTSHTLCLGPLVLQESLPENGGKAWEGPEMVITKLHRWSCA